MEINKLTNVYNELSKEREEVVKIWEQTVKQRETIKQDFFAKVIVLAGLIFSIIIQISLNLKLQPQK